MAKELVVSSNPHETRVAILEDGLVAEVFYERDRSYSLAGSIYKGRVTRILPGMQSAFVNIGLERDAFLYVSDFLEGLEEYDQLMNSLEERTPQRGGRQREEREPRGGEGTGEPANGDSLSPADAQQLAAEAMEGSIAEVQVGDAEVAGAVEVLPGESISIQPRPPQGQQQGQPQGDRPRDGGRDGGRGRGRFGRRGRRGGNRGRGGFPDSKYARGGEPRPVAIEPPLDMALVETAAEIEPEITAPVERILLPGESLAKYRDWARPSDHPSDLAPVHTTPVEIARENEAMEAEHEEEIEEMAAEVVDASTPDTAPVALAAEPVEQEASEVLIAPQAFVPKPFDPDAFQPVDASSFTPEELAQVSEATLNEVKAEAASAGIEWESREDSGSDDGEPSGEASGEDDSEPMSAEGVEGEAVAAEGAERAEGAPAGEGENREAAVRGEGGRNQRFQRRGRWQARRGGRRDGQRREGAPREGTPREGAPTREGGSREQGRRRGGSKDSPREGQRPQAPRPLIGDMLKEGQEIIVQIAKEPLGKKGARITSHIALPGRYVVYMPTLNHVGVSRKVGSDEERQRLKRIVLEAARNFPGGFIVRTAGDGRSDEDVRQDVQYLTKLWQDIKAKAEKSSAPALLHHDPDLVLRTLRDQLSPEFTAIWVDNEQVYEQIVMMVQKFQPALVGRVRLYTKEVPLFEETGVQDEINKALKPKVWLKSGGYIVINQTEALVAIDVNTGKFVGKSNRLEDTIVKTNVEAIQEIVRQIRLRDLGGIIVIDFIDMDERKNRAKVMTELEQAVRADRSPSKILSFNEFGLVAITRKRVRQSLERAICQPCAYCTGSGMVKSPATVSLEILTEAKKQLPELTGKQITIRVNPEVGKTLKSTASSIIDSIEEMSGKGVIIRNDPSVHMENFYFD